MKKQLISCVLLMFGVSVFGQYQLMNPAFAPGGDKAGRAGLGLCCTSQASMGNNPTVMNFFSDLKNKFGDVSFTKADGYAKVQGSAYYVKEFKKAAIYDNGEEVAEFYVRYDAFNDDLEVKRNKYSITAESLIRDKDVSCVVDGREYKYLTFKDEKNNIKRGYVVSIYSGNTYTVYERLRKTYRDGKYAKTSHGTDFPPRFSDKMEYYVAVLDNDPMFVKLSKNRVLDFFNDPSKKELARYIKKKGIGFKNAEDLVSVFRKADLMGDLVAVASQ
ncbi:hypothetical protein F8C76_08945 [Flagellimonas olearia]|uniref:Uncharacterized protein n=1 Tax=Flagellimonas olearia TaxID=552546 RepID=A0A6I1E528_9FLAO|nr:hypothetical protein [Allomuricauda olearia]KAB7531602.1 hypothetical protein F8C76_08945 [Allomuricauda olearia]